MRKCIVLFLLWFSFWRVAAQVPDTIDLAQLQNLRAETEASDLQKKLNESVGAASKKALSLRETPGIVSVITQEDIQKTGARDLMDVLRLVPGFDFAADVNFVTGLTLRGAWSLEGKILVLLDGLELNDLLYQNVGFFNRFPVDLIERVEIIRGPGSAVYGGTAEYGVVNIVSKGAAADEGLMASMSYGFLPDTYGRKNAQLSFIKTISDQVRVDLSLFRGQAIKSDQEYQDLYEEYSPVNLTGITETNTYHVNMGLQVKKFQVRGLFEDYASGDPDLSTQFKNYFITAKNEFKVNDQFTLTPFVYVTHQSPWKQKLVSDGSSFFDNETSRIKGGLYGSYNISRRINLVVGTEYFRDRAEANHDPTYFNGNSSIAFNLYSFYAQGLIKSPFVNITGGFRLDKHNAFGVAFVPRLALTKRLNNFHFKILGSGGYRAPGIDNINLNNDISPEKSFVYELELGYQLTPDMILSLNGYSVKTKDIIVYFYTDIGNGDFVEGYENNSQFGTRGIEATYAFRKSRFQVEANYSFYQAGQSTVDRYVVPGNDRLFVGTPATKATVIAGVDLTKKFSVNTTVNSFGKRYAYTSLDPDGFPQIGMLPAYTLVNLNLMYRNLFAEGLNLSAGVYDLLNERPSVPQAYNGDWAPLSGRSREILVKISYQLAFRARE
ncbi:MAG: TonB-dependent receptor plug domain-containing protein [Cyclobacteriaceae bacterium]|nr:TonB-dependent receptor plug domain-containing protein [Cyclobacteriaceae bacterium]